MNIFSDIFSCFIFFALSHSFTLLLLALSISLFVSHSVFDVSLLTAALINGTVRLTWALPIYHCLPLPLPLNTNSHITQMSKTNHKEDLLVSQLLLLDSNEGNLRANGYFASVSCFLNISVQEKKGTEHILNCAQILMFITPITYLQILPKANYLCCYPLLLHLCQFLAEIAKTKLKHKRNSINKNSFKPAMRNHEGAITFYNHPKRMSWCPMSALLKSE